MSYSKQTWATGDTVTAEKLNHMEDGIDAANDEFVITCTPTAQDLSGTMDKSPADILAAYQAGKKFSIRVMSDGVAANEIEANSIDFDYSGGQLTAVIVNAIFTYSASGSTEKYLVRATTSASTSTYSTEFIELGGGDEPFVITGTVTSPDMTGTVDKTNAEINAAIEAGKQIQLSITLGGATMVMNSDGYDTAEEDGNTTHNVYFHMVYDIGGNPYYFVVVCGGGDEYDGTYQLAGYPFAT